MRLKAREEYQMWPEATAAMVVALVLAVSAFVAAGVVRRNAEAARPQLGSDPVVLLDQGPVSDPASVGRCLLPDVARRADDVQVLYGERQTTPTGRTAPVFVLRNGRGVTQVCDVQTRSRIAELRQPTATPSKPAIPITTDTRTWACSDRRNHLDRFTLSTWLSVTGPVTTGQVRFVLDGEPGKWFTSSAQNGYVHLQAWLEDVERGTSVRLEMRVLDSSGDPVLHTALPGGAHRLSFCPGAVTLG